MANEDIKGMISDMRKNISAVQSKIKAIDNELNAIASCAQSNKVRLAASAVNAATSMENNNNVLHYSNDKLLDTYDTQLQIKELFFIFKDIETANKKIRALNNKLYFEFKNQSKVRKIIIGFLENLNLSIVSSEKLYSVIEKGHLQTPDFWLTYVLIAIMAWKENDKAKTQRAIEGAMELNAKATTLFMMYFNLLLNRIETGLNWFDLYKTMDKYGKDNKTLLMLISSLTSKLENIENSNDEVSKRIYKYLQDEINGDANEINEEEYVSHVRKFYCALSSPSNFEYLNYRKYVNDYQNTAAAINYAKNNEEILSYFTELSHIIKDEKNVFMDNYIQEIIYEPCEGEKAIYDEIEYNEEIIRCVNVIKESKGIVTTNDFKKIAKENYEAKNQHNESKLNSAFEVFNWTYGSTNEKIPTLARWNIFVLNKKYTVGAYNSYVRGYRALNTKEHIVTVNDFSYKTKFENKSKDLGVVNGFIENKRAFLLKKNKKPMFYIGILLTILCVVGIFAAKNQLHILCMVGAVGFAFTAVVSLISNIIKKKKINESMDQKKDKLTSIVSKLYEERAQIDDEFAKADAISKDVNEFLDRV